MLLAVPVCSKIDMQEIERWERQESPIKAMMELVNRLPLHVKDWFPEFVIALKQNNYDDAVEALEPKLLSAGKVLLYFAAVSLHGNVVLIARHLCSSLWF